MKVTGFNSELYVSKLAKVILIVDDLEVEEVVTVALAYKSNNLFCWLFRQIHKHYLNRRIVVGR